MLVLQWSLNNSRRGRSIFPLKLLKAVSHILSHCHILKTPLHSFAFIKAKQRFFPLLKFSNPHASSGVRYSPYLTTWNHKGKFPSRSPIGRKQRTYRTTDSNDALENAARDFKRGSIEKRVQPGRRPALGGSRTARGKRAAAPHTRRLQGSEPHSRQLTERRPCSQSIQEDTSPSTTSKWKTST